MKIEYYKEYSYNLQREMEFKVYGHAGKPMLAFPCQNGRFYEWEGFGMLEVLGDYIESGRLILVTVDSIDQETVSDIYGNPYDAVRRYEAWFNYVINEMIPRVYEITGWQGKLMTTGFSMGAYHAANYYFRRPDVFDKVISLSGLYETDTMYINYMDEVVYANNPIASIKGMPYDHPYIDLYNHSNIVICVGQGAWEDSLLASTRKLDAALKEKGINAWIDYWGYDVNHDWPWWKIQIRYFLDRIL